MSSIRLVRLIKEIVHNTLEAEKPVRVIYGTVTKTDPIEIFVTPEISISSDMILHPFIPCTAHVDNENMTTVTIKYQLSYNDKVALLRVQGGQKFIVLGVI